MCTLHKHWCAPDCLYCHVVDTPQYIIYRLHLSISPFRGHSSEETEIYFGKILMGAYRNRIQVNDLFKVQRQLSVYTPDRQTDSESKL